MRRVVITGLGCISPLGIGVKQTWSSLLANKSGISALTAPEFSSLQSRIAGHIPSFSAQDHGVSRDQIRRMPRFMQFAFLAAKEALSDAKWNPTAPLEREMTGVSIGSGIGAFEDVYETSLLYARAGGKKVSPLFVPRLLINLAAGHISMHFGLQGPSDAASTACATGAMSVGNAMRFIQHGNADVMLAGGAEACIHPLAITGFERSRSLAVDWNDKPDEGSRPFDKQRGGFVMSEGSAVLILEEREHAIKRNAQIYAEILGYGSSSDAHHLTQPPSDGNGALRAMKLALRESGLKPEDVDYINAHATSTALGDIAEARAIKSLMLGEDGMKHEEKVCVSSTKGATGHLLGAAGAIEALFSIKTIEEGRMPGTLNLAVTDEDMPKFDYVEESRQKEVNVVLSNSFGFGGINASLCFRKHED